VANKSLRGVLTQGSADEYVSRAIQLGLAADEVLQIVSVDLWVDSEIARAWGDPAGGIEYRFCASVDDVALVAPMRLPSDRQVAIYIMSCPMSGAVA
jgi:hypothetical protein